MERVKKKSIGAEQSFSSFIIGSYNEDAVKVCRAACVSSLGQLVYVKGEVGSGKTHLFSALSIELKKRGLKVQMQSGEKISNLILRGFRFEGCREHDVFFLDQADIMRRYPHMDQKEFIDLLDCYRGKTIFINGDLHPTANPVLKEWWECNSNKCLVELLHPTRLERVDFLNTLREKYELLMSDHFIQVLAERSKISIRGILGGVGKLQFLKELGLSTIEAEEAVFREEC